MLFLLLCDLSLLEYWIVAVLFIVADELKEQELFIWTHFFFLLHDIDTSGHVLHCI